MQNILTNICNLCCCKPHHTHWPDDIRHTRSCWNRNECHEIVPSMHVNQKLLTTGENVTGTQNTSPPPLFNIKFTQHILCNYFMHSGLQCRCKSSCTHTDSMRLWSWGREAGDAVRGHTVQGEQACCWLSKAEAAKRQRDEHASRHKEELTSKVQTRQSAESLSNDSSEQQPQQCTNTEHQKCKSIA